MEIIEVTDLTDPRLDVYARIPERQLLHLDEPDPGVFIAESPRVIERALEAGYEPLSFLTEDRRLEESLRLAERCSVAAPVYTAPSEVLVKLTGFLLTRGMLCAMRRRLLPPPESLFETADRLVLLENVVNPTNLGAIFRSAAALGMDALLLSPGCSDPLYRRAARVSMGTVFQVPWTFWEAGSWPQAALAGLREQGFVTAAMALCENSVSVRDSRLLERGKLAVVLGTEGDGLMPETIAACDYTVCIPMSHGVDSLNVAAASAVAFWELGHR